MFDDEFAISSKLSSNELRPPSAFQPSSGGMEINPDNVQTVMIIMNTLVGVLWFRYATEFVIDQYRSKLMTHKFKMEAVHKKTSQAPWISHLGINQVDLFEYSTENKDCTGRKNLVKRYNCYTNLAKMVQLLLKLGH